MLMTNNISTSINSFKLVFINQNFSLLIARGTILMVGLLMNHNITIAFTLRADDFNFLFFFCHYVFFLVFPTAMQ